MDSLTEGCNSKNAQYPPFEPGQCWSYRTRLGEEHSRALVLKLDAAGTDLTIVHVRLTGLAINAGNGEVMSYVSHLPVSEAAFAASVSCLDSSGVSLPDFDSGYNDWRLAFDAGEAGIWTAPLASIVHGIEDGLKNQTPVES